MNNANATLINSSNVVDNISLTGEFISNKKVSQASYRQVATKNLNKNKQKSKKFKSGALCTKLSNLIYQI